jgi:hypothetical protein
MTTDRTLDRLIEAYLAPGVDELPDRSYVAVRTATERSRQRVGLGPWGTPISRPRRRPVVATAAVALVAVLALRLLPGLSGFGAGGSATPSLPPTPRQLSPSIAAGGWPATPLEPGSYLTGLSGYRGWRQIQLTVPAGWYTEEGLVFNGPNDGTAPDGSGPTVVLELRQFVDQVNADPCHWSGNAWKAMPTAQAVADALASQQRVTTSAPRAVSLGGTPVTLVETSIPSNLDLQACDNHRLRFLNPSERMEFLPSAGDTFWFYVADTGYPLVEVVVAHAMASASAADVAALQDVVGSIRFVDP